MLLHVHGFLPKPTSQPRTFWHALTPQTRLACTVISVFAIVLTPNGHWETWGVYSLGILSLIVLSRVALTHLLTRLALEFAFVGVVLLGTLFRREGNIVWSWGFLQVTDIGLIVLGSVTIKTLLSLALLNLLILTTSIPYLFQALQALRMPPLMVAIMTSMYRYLQVLIEEFTSMRRAALSRNLMLTNAATRRVIGNMMGSLFIRTYERGERIYQAMLARGYRGLPQGEKLPSYRKRDYLAFTVMGLIIVGGQVIYWVE